MSIEMEAKKRLSYARGYFELGMYRDALAEMRSHAELIPLTRDTAMFALECCKRIGDWSQLAGIAEYIGTRVPDSMPEALVYQATAEFKRGNLGVALSLLDEGIQRQSNPAILWYQLARLFCLIRSFGLAGQALTQAVRLDPALAQAAVEDPDYRDYFEERD